MTMLRISTLLTLSGPVVTMDKLEIIDIAQREVLPLTFLSSRLKTAVNIFAPDRPKTQP